MASTSHQAPTSEDAGRPTVKSIFSSEILPVGEGLGVEGKDRPGYRLWSYPGTLHYRDPDPGPGFLKSVVPTPVF